MKLEDQVCSLELAKRLKELGVKQKSHFYWKEFEFRDGAKPPRSEWRVIHIEGWPPIPYEYQGGGLQFPKAYSAFTVAELGEMLPEPFVSSKTYGQYEVWCKVKSKKAILRANTEADARAKMLIHLIETGVIEP